VKRANIDAYGIWITLTGQNIYFYLHITNKKPQGFSTLGFSQDINIKCCLNDGVIY